ncbi:MAG: lysine exporter LysO family protein, partial [Shewanella sp.]
LIRATLALIHCKEAQSAVSTVVILLPLFIGYCIKLRQGHSLVRIDKLLGQLVYLILGLMGLSLSYIDNLSSQLGQMISIAATLWLCISFCNLLALAALELQLCAQHGKVVPTSKRTPLSLWPSFRLLLMVILGCTLGLLLDLRHLPITQFSEWALMLLLLLIGIQMRSNQVSLRQLLINPWGIKIALTVLLSSWLGACLSAWLLGLPLSHTLAISSSTGWYSLSGILMTEKLGPLLGSAAFINDLARELTAIMIIPLLVTRMPSLAIGYSGATAMDFTLPILQRSGGMNMVSPALISGFILSLLGPILMLAWLA